MLNLLAFDFGASSGKAVLGGFDGTRLALQDVRKLPNEPVAAGGSLYWDILRLYHEMKQCIMKHAVSGRKAVASIGIDTWGVDFGLLDAGGRLLGNPCHYRDARTDGMMAKAFGRIPAREIYETTGIQFMQLNTLYQLLSMKQEQEYMLDNAATMLFIPDLLRYFLTGEKNCEFTIASTSQMVDARLGGWAEPMLERLGLPLHMLTDLVDAGTPAGKLTDRVAGELGTGNIPVVAVAEHDTGSAVVSVPAASGRYAYLSSGTWSIMGLEVPAPVINDTTFGMDYSNEGGINRTSRLLKNIMGLWIYQECKRYWDNRGEAAGFDELEERAAGAEPFFAFIDPNDDSFYRPGDMPEKVREYCRRTGQRPPDDKPQLVRCIMESLALKYRMVLEGIEKIAGYTIPVLHIMGGGCRNTLLSQFTANALARPVFAGPVEAAATGNLIAQLIALGEVKDLAEGRALVRSSFTVTEYMPEDAGSWDEAYGRFVELTGKK
jgi:rhamnulokinase